MSNFKSRSNSFLSNQIRSDEQWVAEFEKNLKSMGVQSRQQDSSIFDQIHSIVNNSKSKYRSVQDAVEDMRERSGLTKYKLAKEESDNSSKAGNIDIKASNENVNSKDVNHVIDKKIEMNVLFKFPNVKNTLENYIKSTRGNLSIPAIINKIKTIHRNDVDDDSIWDNEEFMRLVAKMNLKEKAEHHNSEKSSDHVLGLIDNDSSEDKLDPSNTDAFHALNPVSF